MTIKLIVLALTVATTSFGQLSDSYLTAAYQIIEPTSKEPIGSGFYVTRSNVMFMATARHVLFKLDGTNGWRPKFTKIEVSGFAKDPKSNIVSTTTEIELGQLWEGKGMRASTNRDIALVLVGRRNPKTPTKFILASHVKFKSQLKAMTDFKAEVLRSGIGSEHVGLDAFLFGFPSSIGVANSPQIDHSRPLLRKGIIAGLNPARGTIIIDCPSYQGNSGGPVMLKDSDGFGVIGIVVEWIPFQDVWKNERFGYSNSNLANSGYSVVEPVEGILQMAWE